MLLKPSGYVKNILPYSFSFQFIFLGIMLAVPAYYFFPYHYGNLSTFR